MSVIAVRPSFLSIIKRLILGSAQLYVDGKDLLGATYNDFRELEREGDGKGQKTVS